MKTIKNANLHVLRSSESREIQGGFLSAPSGYYVNGILTPPSIDPNDHLAAAKFLALIGSGPGGRELIRKLVS